MLRVDHPILLRIINFSGILSWYLGDDLIGLGLIPKLMEERVVVLRLVGDVDGGCG